MAVGFVNDAKIGSVAKIGRLGAWGYVSRHQVFVDRRTLTCIMLTGTLNPTHSNMHVVRRSIGLAATRGS